MKKLRFPGVASFLLLAIFAEASALGRPASADPLERLLEAEPQAAKRTSFSRPLVDFAKTEVELLLGVAVYSGDFESSAQPCAGLRVCIPTPGVMKKLGGFAEVLVSTLDRDIEGLETSKGEVLFLGFGADYDLVNETKRYVRGQLGGMYIDFGSVTATESGFAFLFGAEAGWRISRKIWLSASPHLCFSPDTSDYILLLTAGFQLEF